MVHHQRERKVRFPGGRGIELSGIVHEPASASAADTVLLAHCFTCSKDYKLPVAIARALAEQGVRAVRFDFAGSGQSSGRFSDTSLTTNISDLLAAADWIQSHGWAVKALVGHSLGGAAAILAADRMPSVAAVCAIATPSSTLRLLELLPQLTTEEFRRSGSAEVTIGPRAVRIERRFVDDLGLYSLEEALRKLNRGLLVVQGAQDRTTPMAEAEKLFSYARQPKAFLAVPGADHLFSQKEHAWAVGQAVALWLRLWGVKGNETGLEE